MTTSSKREPGCYGERKEIETQDFSKLIQFLATHVFKDSDARNKEKNEKFSIKCSSVVKCFLFESLTNEITSVDMEMNEFDFQDNPLVRVFSVFPYHQDPVA